MNNDHSLKISVPEQFLPYRISKTCFKMELSPTIDTGWAGGSSGADGMFTESQLWF